MKKTQLVPIEPQELVALRQLIEQTFREAYEHRSDPIQFEQHVQDAFALRQIEQDYSTPKQQAFWFKLEGDIVGYVWLFWNRDLIREAGKEVIYYPGKTVEISRFYILKQYWRQGLGKVMMQDIEDYVQTSHEVAGLSLVVWNENEEAIQFYRKVGFTTVGKYDYVFGDEIHEDYLMYKAI